jgi:hypothetical protein
MYLDIYIYTYIQFATFIAEIVYPILYPYMTYIHTYQYNDTDMHVNICTGVVFEYWGTWEIFEQLDIRWYAHTLQIYMYIYVCKYVIFALYIYIYINTHL